MVSEVSVSFFYFSNTPAGVFTKSFVERREASQHVKTIKI